MKALIVSVAIFLVIIILNGCQDTLGVNNTKYLQEASRDTLSVDTVIREYKKIIITEVVEKYDTTYVYDTIPITREPVFHQSYKIELMEFYANASSGKSDYSLNGIKVKQMTSMISYLNYLPELNVNLFIQNSDSTLFKRDPYRNSVLSSINFSIKDLSVINDYPINLYDYVINKKANLEIGFNDRSGNVNYFSIPKIYAQIQIGDRLVINNQIKRLTLYVLITFPPYEIDQNSEYYLSFNINLIFPG